MSHLLRAPIRAHLRAVLASAASTDCKYASTASGLGSGQISLVPVHELGLSRSSGGDRHSVFLNQKRVIFRKVKESKDLRGGVLLYVAQANPKLDAEIAEKGR